MDTVKGYMNILIAVCVFITVCIGLLYFVRTISSAAIVLKVHEVEGHKCVVAVVDDSVAMQCWKNK